MGPTGRLPQAALLMLPLAGYALVLGLLFLPVLSGARTLFAGDIHQHYLPWEHFASQELRAGHLPTWNRGLYMGHPLFAEGQAAILYPITRFWYGTLGGGLAANIRAFNWDVISHWAIAGWGVFFLASALGLRWRSAVLAGLFACLAGQFLVLPVNVPLLRVAVWAGWLLAWGVLYLRTGAWWYLAATTLTWTLTLLAGGPQMVALLYLASFLLGVLSLGELKTNPRPYWSVGLLLVSPVVAFGLAAVQLVPTYDLYRQSAIAQLAGEESLSFSASWTQLSTLLLPPTWAMRLPYEHPLPSYVPLGLWLGTIGSVGALLSLFVAAAPLRLKILLGVLLLFALGANTPVYPALLQAVPMLGAFRAPDRFLAIAVVPLCVLAGFGIEALLSAEDAELPVRKRLWTLLVLVLAIGGLAAYLALGIRATGLQREAGVAEGWWVWSRAAIPDLMGHLLIGALLAAATLPTVVRRLHPAITLGGATALTVAQCWLLMPLVPPLKTIPTSALAEPPPLAKAILAHIADDPQRYWGRVQMADPQRQAAALFPEMQVATTDGRLQTDLLSWYHGAGPEPQQKALIGQLHPNVGNLWGLEYAGGIASLYTARADEYMGHLQGTQLPQFLQFRERPRGRTLMDLAGVGYLVMPEAVPRKLLGSEPVGDLVLGLNVQARPLAYLMQPSAIYPEDNPEVMRGVVQLQIDPGQVLVLDSVDEPQTGLPQDPAVPAVKWFWQNSSTLLAECEALGPGWLIFNQQWMPGWRATINGRGVPLHRAWWVQMAVPVKAGPNRVELRYTQPGYAAGLQISLITLLGL
ncbi:MAG TPA: YfhO family protein, partial [bacterium]|nr:YfhO family protein [bacterium]